jgi:polar amino acid transport system ATP-binding protein
MTASVSATQDAYTITLSQVCKSYGDYQVLKDVNENVTRGEVVVICGPSGSGKSTLIRTINRWKRSAVVRSCWMARTSMPRCAPGN